jgi:hypothetical protein
MHNEAGTVTCAESTSDTDQPKSFEYIEIPDGAAGYAVNSNNTDPVSDNSRDMRVLRLEMPECITSEI